jgi:hypothetical protein
MCRGTNINDLILIKTRKEVNKMKEEKVVRKEGEIETVILPRLEVIEGLLFAGQIAVSSVLAECSCQNCGCDSRQGQGCGCNPNCSCQGHSAITDPYRFDPFRFTFGRLIDWPLEDIKSVQELAAKVKKRAEK